MHNKVKTIDVQEFKKHHDANPNLCLIDVRELNEWQEVHIPGALHIPQDTLPAQIAKKIPDYNQPIYLHCRGGVRSLHAAQKLIELGYKEVYSLDGGITAWEKCGYPIKK